MKKNIIFIISIFALVCHSLYAEIESKTQTLSESFNSVNLDCNAILHIKIGDENKLLIKTEESVLKNVNAAVKNNELKLTCSGQKKIWWDIADIFSTEEKIELYLTVKELTGFTVSKIGKVFIDSNINTEDFTISILGASDVHIKDISVNNLKINTLGGGGEFKLNSLQITTQFEFNSSGSGHFYFEKLAASTADITITGNSSVSINHMNCKQLNALILGSGSIALVGKAETQNVKVDGSGRYNCGRFITQNAKVKSFGGSSVDIYAGNSVSADIFGSGMVSIDGQPQVNECSIYGKGNVILQKGSSTTI